MTADEKRQALNRVPQRLDVLCEYECDDGGRSWTNGWRLTGRVRLNLVAVLARDVVLDSVVVVGDTEAWDRHNAEVRSARAEAREHGGFVHRGRCICVRSSTRSRFRC